MTPNVRTTARADNQNMAPMLSGRGGGDNAAGACRLGGTLSGRSLDAAGKPHPARVASRLADLVALDAGGFGSGFDPGTGMGPGPRT